LPIRPPTPHPYYPARMTSVPTSGFGVSDNIREPQMSDKELEGALRRQSTGSTGPAHEVVPFGKPSFAEYLHWATLRRAVEASDTGMITHKGIAQLFKPEKGEKDEKDDCVVVREGSVDSAGDEDMAGMTESQIEYLNARRALRQAGWATVFYLITYVVSRHFFSLTADHRIPFLSCDILGPFNAPYAIMAVGIAPGVLLYVLFGTIAAITGAMLCRLFLRLDSVRYPIKTYGDLAGRVFGPWARHLCSILQSIQLVLNVGLIVLSTGQSLSQITKGQLCFSVCVVIWALVGMFLGQVRGLQNFGIIANASVYINLLIIFISMGFIAHSPPNYAAATSSYGIPQGPILVQTIVHQPLFAQVNGVFNMVFAYGGAMIFPEIMAEMRRPKDFIRGMAMAQALIFTVYLTYGVFVYAFQGQFTLAVAYQGVSKYAWQTVGNTLGLISSMIAAGLYGNIGLKVFYITIIEDLFHGPSMTSRKGRMIWAPLVVVYWGIAFVIGSAIPAVGALSGLVAAACIFQFTYTFPPAIMLGFDICVDAQAEDEPFLVAGIAPIRADSWKNVSRWRRGIFGGGRKRVALKFVNFLFLIAALATAGLGLWATGTDLAEAIQVGAASSFGCAAPV
ncbi:hypothetical protein P7C70_g5023, partial [Phenoliferia sp. Uapishka_3]